MTKQEAEAELDAVYLPPVSQGDVYRAAMKRPRAIGIIDGYFNQVPAVWHKEILWAIAQGIPVFGSASMGALRAAELAPFGMQGVGKIFEAYRDGILEDDDEVALAHAPADFGYRPLSEAMINIRTTLAAAEIANVISSTTKVSLGQTAKSLFYPDRNYARILQLASDQGLPNFELQAFQAWLPEGQINQKREDALAMLQTMRIWLAENISLQPVQYSFEHTALWNELTNTAGELLLEGDIQPETVFLETLVSKLQLDGNTYDNLREQSMARLLALDEAQRHGLEIDSDTLYQTVIAFRHQHGLMESEDLERWIRENKLSRGHFIQLMEEEAKLRWVKSLLESEITNTLLNQLRVMNQFTSLLACTQNEKCLLSNSHYDF
ncbi:MAG: TfuA-like protein [Cyanobacteriota bacterium]